MECLKRQSHVEVVAMATNGREALELLSKHAIDLLFLDVQMPELDGFDVLRQMEGSRPPVTIFVTAYDQYAIKAFEQHAFDYLLKPFSDERFESAMRTVRQHLRGPDTTKRDMAMVPTTQASAVPHSYLEHLTIRLDGRIKFLKIDEIDWIESEGMYVRLHVGKNSYLLRSGLTQLLEVLDPSVFVRLHRSAVVNASRILELHPRAHGDYTVVLRNGTELTMSRAYREQLEAWLGRPL